jgi:hypothetical protein
MRKLVPLAVVLFIFCPNLQAQQPLDNEAVIKLSRAGVSDDLLVTTINASPAHYDVSPNGVIALKAAKLSDKVVAAIVLKANGATNPTSALGIDGPAPAFKAEAGYPATGPNGLPPGIDDFGVYYKDLSGKWIPILPETVTFESASKLTDIVSAGIVKSDLNGQIDGAKAQLTAQLPVVFAVYLAPNVEITEYVLLELHPTLKLRTFLSAEAGFLHTEPRAQRDQINFQPEKLAPRLYQITLPADEGSGEYGLLAPGVKRTSNKEVVAKIYTVSATQ